MLSRALFLLSTGIFFLEARAQSDVDALRFSITQNTGTARNISLGNTMGSVGADLSVLHTNPAGLAKFTTTEFSMTPAISIFGSNSDFIGQTTTDSKVNFQLYNIGMAFGLNNSSSNPDNKWNGIKLGFSYNRVANFNQEHFMSGYNEKNSLADNYYETLRDNTSSTYEAENNFPFGASLAYNTDLVYFDTIDNRYYTSVNANVRQDITLHRKGGLDEIAFSIASGYNDKIFLGATLGVPILNYTDEAFHKETDLYDSSFSFNFFEQSYWYQTNGAGINFKFGMLAQPTKNIRLSLAFHTPGILFAHDDYLANIFSDYQAYTAEATSPAGYIQYHIRLPWRLLTGGTFLHKYGLIAVEYELSDAGGAKYNFDEANADIQLYEQDLNNSIQEKYKVYHTLKLGAEAKLDPMRLRVGFQYQTTPFQNEYEPASNKSDVFTYSAGIGYRNDHWNIDAAYQFTKTTEIFVPYTLSTEAVPYATMTGKRSVIAFTVGYRIGG